MLKGRAVKEPTNVQRQTVYWESLPPCPTPTRSCRSFSILPDRGVSERCEAAGVFDRAS
jgi:hypothetical protein